MNCDLNPCYDIALGDVSTVNNAHYIVRDGHAVLVRYYGGVSLDIEDSVSNKGRRYSVNKIGPMAFVFVDIEHVTIPDTIETIGAFVFAVHFDSGVYYSGSGSGLESISFRGNSALSTIGDWAFAGTSIESITLPDSVETIGDNAFDGCELLKTVDFARSAKLHTVGNEAFIDCSSLEGIDVPSAVTNLGYYTFSNCTSLREVTFGYGIDLDTLHEGVFANSGIVDIDIPNSVDTIQKNVFYSCTMLESVSISRYVTDMDSSAFSMCDRLDDFRVNSANPTYKVVSGVLYSKNGEELLMNFANRDAESTCVPSSVTTIGAYAYHNFTNLRSITIPEQVEAIGTDAFYNCPSLVIYAEVAVCHLVGLIFSIGIQTTAL